MHYSQEIADQICERLIEGESLRTICASDGFPSRASVLRWMAANPDFEAKCARARAMQADLMDDLILDVAMDCTEENCQSSKVKLSAYQWRASKLAPKKYGDRVAMTGADGGPIELRTVLVPVQAVTARERPALKPDFGQTIEGESE